MRKYREFDYVNEKKIDLKNQDHVEMVIKRNKGLEKAFLEGFSVYNILYKSIMLFDCLKCGNEIKSEVDFEMGYQCMYIDELTPAIVTCDTCNTTYTLDDDVYRLKIAEDL